MADKKCPKCPPEGAADWLLSWGDLNTLLLTFFVMMFSAAEIDGYLAGRYEVPISPAPQILTKVNRDLAIYNLYARVKSSVPELWKERYDNAIKLLIKVGEGKLTLGIQPPPDAAGDGNYEGGAQVTVRTKDFDSTTMTKY